MATTRHRDPATVRLPAFVVEAESTAGADPASITARVRDAVVKCAVRSIGVDEHSLDACIRALVDLAQRVQARIENQTEVEMDGISVDVGVSAKGQVAFLGTGVGLETAARITIRLKTSPTASPKKAALA